MDNILTQAKKKKISTDKSHEMILFVGTKIGVFILYSDMNKRIWELSGPYLYGLKIINIIYEHQKKKLYVAYQKNKLIKIFKSDDLGKSWVNCNKSYDLLFKNKHLSQYHSDDIIYIISHLYESNHIYCQTKSGIRYINSSQNIDKLIKKHTKYHSGKTLVVDPNNYQRLWYFPTSIDNHKYIEKPVGQPHVLCTDNLGREWYKQDIGFPIDNAWFSINKRSFISDSDSCLYLGTKSGMIWYSDTLGNHWQPIISYLPPIIVMKSHTLK